MGLENPDKKREEKEPFVSGIQGPEGEFTSKETLQEKVGGMKQKERDKYIENLPEEGVDEKTLERRWWQR